MAHELEDADVMDSISKTFAPDEPMLALKSGFAGMSFNDGAFDFSVPPHTDQPHHSIKAGAQPGHTAFRECSPVPAPSKYGKHNVVVLHGFETIGLAPDTSYEDLVDYGDGPLTDPMLGPDAIGCLDQYNAPALHLGSGISKTPSQPFVFGENSAQVAFQPPGIPAFFPPQSVSEPTASIPNFHHDICGSIEEEPDISSLRIDVDEQVDDAMVPGTDSAEVQDRGLLEDDISFAAQHVERDDQATKAHNKESNTALWDADDAWPVADILEAERVQETLPSTRRPYRS